MSKKGREVAVPAPPLRLTEAAAAPESTRQALLMAQERELRTKLKELRDHIVKERRQCRRTLPNEARKMHYGDIEHRSDLWRSLAR